MVLWSHWQCKEPGNAFPCLTPSLLQRGAEFQGCESEEGLRNQDVSLWLPHCRGTEGDASRESQGKGHRGEPGLRLLNHKTWENVMAIPRESSWLTLLLLLLSWIPDLCPFSRAAVTYMSFYTWERGLHPVQSLHFLSSLLPTATPWCLFAAGTSTKWDHPNHMDFDPVCISEMIFTNFPHVSIFRTTDWLMCYHSPASLMATQGWISIFSNIFHGIAGTWDSLKVLHSAQILFGWRSGRIKGGPFPGLLGWHHNSSSTGLGQICRVLLFLEKIQDAKCLGGSAGHLQQGVRTQVKLQTLSPLRKVYFWKKICPMSTHLLNTSKD